MWIPLTWRRPTTKAKEQEPEIYVPKLDDWVMTRRNELPFFRKGDIGRVVELHPYDERSFRVCVDFTQGARVFLGADGVYFRVHAADRSVEPRCVVGGGTWWADVTTEEDHLRCGLIHIPFVAKGRAPSKREKVRKEGRVWLLKKKSR